MVHRAPVPSLFPLLSIGPLILAAPVLSCPVEPPARTQASSLQEEYKTRCKCGVSCHVLRYGFRDAGWDAVHALDSYWILLDRDRLAGSWRYGPSYGVVGKEDRIGGSALEPGR